jgi:hypothetical protein
MAYETGAGLNRQEAVISWKQRDGADADVRLGSEFLLDTQRVFADFGEDGVHAVDAADGEPPPSHSAEVRRALKGSCAYAGPRVRVRTARPADPPWAESRD